jgi:hypothetical protein
MKKNIKNNEIIIYKGEEGQTKIEVTFQGETVWLTQAQIAKLFSKGRSTVAEHIQNIFKEGELDEKAVCRNFRHTSKHGAIKGKTQESIVKYYNLDTIISVGYRVKSVQGTQFRIWATARLREYIIKGFTMDDERLKGTGGGNYWKELLDRIRDIRSSEKVLYRQILDLYALSMDYDPKNNESKKFFAIVQNKLHYAANGKTASEIVLERANADSPFMGLMTFGKNGIHKADVAVAKNYLNTKEIKRLNNVVSAYFDIAELRALDEKETRMQDYINQLDKLIVSMDRAVLQDAGKVSHIEAEAKAHAEYRKYQIKTLSPVEESYFENMKSLQKKVAKNVKLKSSKFKN